MRTGMLLLLAASMMQGPPGPALDIEAPPELAAERARLAAVDTAPLASIAHFVGLESAGPPIRVMLVPETSALAREVPPPVVGFAHGESDTVVIFPARAPVYPDDTLEDVLRHEVAHILIHRAAGGRHVPRWFHEGLAMASERAWGLRDQTRLVYELTLSVETPLDEIERLFSGNDRMRLRAYTLSGAFVRDLLHRHGAGMPAAVLERVAGGDAFETAFVRTTGILLPEAERAFWESQRLWTTWLPFLTSSAAIWMAVTFLALYAIRRRRQKSAALRKKWAMEDGEDYEPLPEERVH